MDLTDPGAADPPLDAAGWRALADRQLHARHLADAEHSYRHCLALGAEDADVHAGLGYIAHLDGRLADAEASYRAALRLAPERALAWTNLGLVLRDAGHLAEAELAQREALRHAPDFPDAHNNLGLVQYDLGRLAEAENNIRGALQLRPEHAGAWMNLGVVCQAKGALAEAESCYRHALRLGADPARVEGNLGLALLEQHRVAEAEAACRRALHHRPDCLDARLNLAMALLLQGRYEEGWQAYEARWQVPPLAGSDRGFAPPRWTGAEPVAGKVVLLWAEQGFGDTLQFCRYAPILAALGAQVVLAVQQPLVRLMMSLAPVTRVVALGDALPPYDLHCPLLSLPLRLGTTLANIPGTVPYLRPAPTQAAAWRAELAHLPGRRIGLVWAGSGRDDQPHAAAVDRRRSLPLAALAPLVQVPGCAFISLQLGPPAAQASAAPPGLLLHDPTERLGDFADTAALIDALDLVISVDTAVAHLAGALGKPVWLLNRFDTCWRWLRDREDSPWYPTLRQFRQPAPGDWGSVIARVAGELRACPAGSAPVRDG